MKTSPFSGHDFEQYIWLFSLVWYEKWPEVWICMDSWTVTSLVRDLEEIILENW